MRRTRFTDAMLVGAAAGGKGVFLPRRSSGIQMGVPGNASLRAYLEDAFTEPVRDPLWGHIYLSPAFTALTRTPEFNLLAGIRQLGPTHWVYPGATHTRRAHSLGVFHLARRMTIALLRHPGCPPLRREEIDAFLAAALLHDVGHFPYTHSFSALDLEEHEVLTARLVRESSLATVLRREVGVDPGMVAAIIDGALDGWDAPAVDLFRHLLSGSLDPDKLDYLNRDAAACGVPYGRQDIDFVLSRIVPAGYRGVALAESGVTTVENILFAKYLMYRAVYWHRGVRSATAMVKKAVYRGLESATITPDALYGLDDQGFIDAHTAARHPAFGLIERVARGDLLEEAVDIPFDPADRRLAPFASIAVRSAAERHLAERLSLPTVDGEAIDIVIDVPDPVSFEAAIPIVVGDGTVDFVEASVFTEEVVRRFTGRLRRLRLFLPAGHPVDNARAAFADLLDSGAAASDPA